MRLKSFLANSMREAMHKVREELGEDAIIVTTREMSGGRVRITAAIEQQNRYGIDLPEFDLDETVEDDPRPDVSETQGINTDQSARPEIFPWRPAPMAEPPPEKDDFLAQWLEDSGEIPGEHKQEDIIELVTDAMLRHRFPANVSEKIISTATLIEGRSLRETLAKAIATHFDFDPLPLGPYKKPIILVGPPGAGKTLNTAKLATRAVMNGLKPAVISTDIVRAGGLEMLSTFLDVLDLELDDADSPQSLKAAIDKNQDADQILIDTGGLNPFDPHEMKDLARLLKVTEMEPILVLPAGGDAEESAEMALTFEILGVKRIYPTRLDFARRLGGVMAAADRGKLSFAGASHTHKIPDGILDITPQVLADLLMPGSYLKG